MKEITNTQYLKIGDHTNYGKVTKIHDNNSVETDGQFTWNVSQGIIKYKICKYCSTQVSDETQDLCNPCFSMSYYI